MRKQLRRRMTLFVLIIMVSSGVLTTIMFILILRLRLLPSVFWATVWMPAIPLAVSSLLGTVLAGLFSQAIFGPLSRLNDATQRVAKGDFSVRVDHTGVPSEMRGLFDNFNSMTEELGSIELFREDFINTFSHEFKTPIVSIRGFARQLKKPDLDEAQKQEYIDIIIAESERLTAMSANVLLLSKLENQQMIPDQDDFSLDEQIRDCIVLTEKAWSAKEIEWNLDLPVIRFYSDPKMTEHIWLNLLSNAIKFSPPGGEITVKAWQSDRKWHITIQDHGPGMTAEVAAHVFERFYQGGGSRAAEGNGLGLSIVHRVVKLCGGTVSVTTAPGQGSIFMVELPAEIAGEPVE